MTRQRDAALAPEELDRVGWRISGRSSGGGGNCVEAGPVRDGSGRVALRHSHHPRGQAFAYGADEWRAFLDDVKQGTYDFAR